MTAGRQPRVLAALGIAASCVLADESSLWLIAATVLLVVRRLGDSLDGISRPGTTLGS